MVVWKVRFILGYLFIRVRGVRGDSWFVIFLVSKYLDYDFDFGGRLRGIERNLGDLEESM